MIALPAMAALASACFLLHTAAACACAARAAANQHAVAEQCRDVLAILSRAST